MDWGRLNYQKVDTLNSADLELVETRYVGNSALNRRKFETLTETKAMVLPHLSILNTPATPPIWSRKPTRPKLITIRNGNLHGEYRDGGLEP